MSPVREVELKLEVPVHSLYRLARSPLLQAARKKRSKPSTLVSVYFDTDKLKLRDKGLSLRVRRIGRHHVQTIKPRNEWEHQISGGLSSKSGESRMPAASSERAASRRHSLPGREEAPIAYVLKDAQRAYRAFAKAKRFWL